MKNESKVTTFTPALNMLRILDNVDRQKMLAFCANHPEWCARDYARALNLPNTTISSYFKMLIKTGVVSAETAGREKFYRVNVSRLAQYEGACMDIESIATSNQAVRL